MINKVESLEKLREWGFPTAIFQIFKDEKEIQWFGENEAKEGWCLRTSLTGKDIRLPFATKLNKNQVYEKIKEFKKVLGDNVVFILHPHLKFIKSGNLMILKDKIILEAVDGFVRPLSSGERFDVHYTFLKRKNLPLVEKLIGNKELLSNTELITILDYIKKIPMQNVVLEWSIGDFGKLRFHDFIEITD